MVLKINSVDVPTAPSEFRVNTHDIMNEESTIRTANGKLHIDRITTKSSVEVMWAFLTDVHAQQMLTMLQSTTVNLTYKDPKEGVVTKEMAVSEKNLTMSFIKDGVTYWEALSTTFTEI